MNQRQEITAGARALDEDGSPTCSHLSNDPQTRARQIRAVALDRLVGSTMENIDAPTFSLVVYRGEPVDVLARQAAAYLGSRCRFVIDNDIDAEEAAEMYASTLFSPEDEYGIEESTDEAMFVIDSFLMSAATFSFESLRLATLALPSTSTDELYRKLRKGGYPGMAKKFTSGKSLQRINNADAALSACTNILLDAVLEEPDGIRTVPNFVEIANQSLPKSLRDSLSRAKSEEGLDDRPGVCTGSIDIHGEGVPVVAEKVWVWLIDVARASQLIESIREIEGRRIDKVRSYL